MPSDSWKVLGAAGSNDVPSVKITNAAVLNPNPADATEAKTGWIKLQQEDGKEGFTQLIGLRDGDAFQVTKMIIRGPELTADGRPDGSRKTYALNQQQQFTLPIDKTSGVINVRESSASDAIAHGAGDLLAKHSEAGLIISKPRTVANVQSVDIVGQAVSFDATGLRNQDALALKDEVKGGGIWPFNKLPTANTGWITVVTHGTDANGKPTQDTGKVKLEGSISGDYGVSARFFPEHMTFVDQTGKLVKMDVPKSKRLNLQQGSTLTLDYDDNRSQLSEMIQGAMNSRRDLRLAQEETKNPAQLAASQVKLDGVKLADSDVSHADNLSPKAGGTASGIKTIRGA